MEENTEVKKNNKVLCIVIVVLALILVVLGALFITHKVKNIEGYYELYEMSSGEENYSHDAIENLKSLGMNVSLVLNKDKTGTLTMFGKTKELTYNGKYIIVDGESAPYNVEDDKLIMEQDNQKLVFQKTEKTTEENTDVANNQEQ